MELFHKVEVEYVATADSDDHLNLDDSYKIKSSTCSSIHFNLKLKPMQFNMMRFLNRFGPKKLSSIKI